VLDALVANGTPYRANRALSAIKKLLNWALNRGMIDVNPVAGQRMPTKECDDWSKVSRNSGHRSSDVTGPDLGRGGTLPANWTLNREPYYLETSMPGVFAAGDVRHSSIKRLASAVGEGAMVVAFVHRYLAAG